MQIDGMTQTPYTSAGELTNRKQEDVIQLTTV